MVLDSVNVLREVMLVITMRRAEIRVGGDRAEERGKLGRVLYKRVGV